MTMSVPSATSEPFGTTPLPVDRPYRVNIDLEMLSAHAQQPQTQSIANYESAKNDLYPNGRLLKVNPHFMLYAVKNGLIRVLHRHTPLRSLLRSHVNQTVTDIKFFHDSDVVATCGSSDTTSTVVIWRIFERSNEISSEVLLEIATPYFRIWGIQWHPFNSNQFWMLHQNENDVTVASLVETTRITTTPHPQHGHAVCEFAQSHVIMEGAIQLGGNNNTAPLKDLSWSNLEARQILTCHHDDNVGQVILWDLKKLQSNSRGIVTVESICRMESKLQHSRCLFLPHESAASAVNATDDTCLTTCFLTASSNCTVVTLWSPFVASGKQPLRLQVLEFEKIMAMNLDLCYGQGGGMDSPPSSFVVMSDRDMGKLVALHLRSDWNEQKQVILRGCDYAVPFSIAAPVYSWNVGVVPTTDISDEDISTQNGLDFDAKLHCLTLEGLRCYTLTSFMCLPPEHSYVDPTPGVRVSRLEKEPPSAHASDVLDDDEEGNKHTDDNADVVHQYDEDYDVQDDEDSETYDPPDPSSLPTPDGIDTAFSNLADNPFANWLGAIASKTSDSKTQPAPSPIPTQPASTAAVTAHQFLSPSEISKNNNADKARAAPERQPTPVATNCKGGASTSHEASNSISNVARGNGTIDTNEFSNVSVLKREGGNGHVASHVALTGQNDKITAEIRAVLRDELQTTFLPAMEQIVNKALDASVIHPIQDSLDRFRAEGTKIDYDKLTTSTARALDDPLQSTYSQSIKNVFIPAIESITSQVFERVANRLDQVDDQQRIAADRNQDMLAMSSQLATLTQLVAKLTEQIKTLSANTQPLVSAQSTVSETQPKTHTRAEVLSLLQKRQYEEAFTRAVSASTAELVVFCCSNVQIEDVLGDEKAQLSQPILLCLMQQLGTVLVLPTTASDSNLQLEIDWLQELAYTLNPEDDSIKKHVPGVLKQLVSSINTRLRIADAVAARPLNRLLKIVRGMQIS